MGHVLRFHGTLGAQDGMGPMRPLDRQGGERRFPAVSEKQCLLVSVSVDHCILVLCACSSPPHADAVPSQQRSTLRVFFIGERSAGLSAQVDQSTAARCLSGPVH